MDAISARESRRQIHKTTTLCLAFQSLGVVYGDLSTSPIYVYRSTFSGSLRFYEANDEIFGVLSLVFWTLTIIALCKYIVFVLGADDNGEGGTFALYSLLCRHSKMGLLQSYHSAYDRISPTRSSGGSPRETKTSLYIKEFFEKHENSRILILLVVLLGTSMVIGDGILTPTMSVLSAVSGIQTKVESLHENYIVLIASIILMGLFALQHYGTQNVGFLFAPILIAWLLCIGAIGIYNVIHWNPQVFYALSPYYIYNFFNKTGRRGWGSLGGVVLCITGTEAMFVDLGHFSKLSIRIAFAGVVYPCLVLAYMGEAAYLSKNRDDLRSSFYKAIPNGIFWPVFVIATLATVVGSQAVISATFSIISHCRKLRCFPRVKIKHTSSYIRGQIYIPEANWILMVLCLAVTIGFRDTKLIGNAYGLAVITVMFVTTCLMFLIISTVWKKNVLWAIMFVLFFGCIELCYLSSCLAKVPRGGWVPLLVSLIVLSVMSIWHYGTSKKDKFEQQHKVCLQTLLSLGPSLGIVRVPGIGIIYSNVPSDVPPMFAHFITNFPAFHKILLFVTFQTLMVPRVPNCDRFEIGRLGPSNFYMFRCVVRYGYKDVRDWYKFETQIIEKVVEFLQCDNLFEETVSTEHSVGGSEIDSSAGRQTNLNNAPAGPANEVKEILEAKEFGVAYLIGNTHVRATRNSPLLKKFAINIVYDFLRRNCRSAAIELGIPHPSLIEVGVVYQV